jgi:hypothetical protein
MARCALEEPGLWELFGTWLAAMHPGIWEEIQRMARTRGKGFKIDLRPVIDTLGLPQVINQLGVKRVMEAVGMKRVVKEMGVDWMLDQLTPEQLQEIRRRLQ